MVRGGWWLFGGLVLATGVASSALATPPGGNGRIAFTRWEDRTRATGALFTIEPSGAGLRRLTRPSAGTTDTAPDWSPDGRTLVFHRDRGGFPAESMTVKADGTGLRRLDPPCPPGASREPTCQEFSPSWSPDGRRIAFGWEFANDGDPVESKVIAVMDADGRNPRILTQRGRHEGAHDHSPSWSPDGRRIAFVRANTTARPKDARAIFVVNADGSGLRRLTPWALEAGDFTDWSPDGSRILFRAPSSVSTDSNLYTVQPDGRGLRKLTRYGFPTEVLSGSFSPDGKQIVFSKTGRGDLPDVFTMVAGGGAARPVTTTASWESSGDWGPR